MKRVASVFGVVCAIVLTGGVLFAQEPQEAQQLPPGPPAGGARHHGGGLMGPGGEAVEGFMVDRLVNDPELAKQLNLSTNQTDQLRALRSGMQKQMIDLRDVMEKAARQQAELVSAATPDEAAVMKAVEATGAARTDIAKVQVKHLLAVMKVLTPEQQQKIKNMQRERMQNRHPAWKDKGHATGTSAAPASAMPPPPPPEND